jgi:mono/diheme cytochrome c family protein
MVWKIAAAATAVIGGAAFFVLAAPVPESGAFAYKDPEIVAQGEVIYAQHCAACHGANLEGQPDWRERDADGYLPAPPHDETGHTWHHPDAQLIEIISLGTEAVVGGNYRSNMIGYGDVLSDDEIVAVLAYIKSTWPRRIIERHDELNAAYEAAN